MNYMNAFIKNNAHINNPNAKNDFEWLPYFPQCEMSLRGAYLYTVHFKITRIKTENTRLLKSVALCKFWYLAQKYISGPCN